MSDVHLILPEPAPEFEWGTRQSRPALVCRQLAAYADHFYTTRAWPLGSRADAGADGWADVAAAAGVAPGRLVRVRQVHRAGVRHYRAGDPIEPLPEADIITASAGADAALAIQTADCAPIAIVDPRTGASAVAHAGWRGLALGVPRRAVAALGEAWGSKPSELLAAIGPCIGACCYEVGGDVREAFGGYGREADDWFSRRPTSLPNNPPMPGLRASRGNEKWFFDGWRSARDQLQAAGMAAERIFVAALCTASHPDAFPSYRRDGTAAGRMAAVVTVRDGRRRPDPSRRSPDDRRVR